VAAHLLRDDVIQKHGEAFDCSNTLLNETARSAVEGAAFGATFRQWSKRGRRLAVGVVSQ
jgi:hypothetical protein